MKFTYKNLLILLLVCALSLSPLNVSAASVKYVDNSGSVTYKGTQYKLYFNNALINSTTKPVIKKNGDYLIPYQYAFVSRGPKLKAVYISQTECVTLMLKTKRVKMFLNKKYYYVDNVKKTSKTAPLRVTCSKETYIALPLQEICTAFGWKYTVSDSQKKIKITAPVEVTNHYDDIKASQFKNMSPSQFITKMGPIARDNYKKTGILASVTLAQAILESGWGKSGLAQKANNLFGMKASVSGNNWKGSTWKGNYVTVRTKEQYGGRTVTISAKFRKYSSVSQSLEDHAAYLKYAKNGSRYRYAGITATKDYRRQLRIIQNGGYCTGSSYYSQLCSIIRSYNLTRWDK